MKQKPLSMKRLTIMAGNYCVSLGEKKGWAEFENLKRFISYVWEHKDDNLLDFPKVK